MSFEPRSRLVLASALLGTVLVPPALAQGTLRASVSSAGAQANADCFDPSLSADGRHVAFYSLSTTLVAGETGVVFDVFVRDVASGTTVRASTGLGGALGDDRSWFPSISADGRYVAFESRATNLVAGDANQQTDVFVRDLLLGTTVRASAGAGGEANGSSFDPAISADGRYVAFDSTATNLVAGDTNGVRDVFVRDLVAGTTERVSVATGGAQAGGGSKAAISGDGRFVAFESDAADLLPGDSNGHADVFVHDRQTGTTERVNLSSAGVEADDYSQNAAISADGRFVAFESAATALVAGDSNGHADVFLRDRTNATTERVSVGPGGAEPDQPSFAPAISADGRHVAYWSYASNLVAADTNANADVFLRDRLTGSTVRASVPDAGGQANGFSEDPAVSSDGRFVAFSSEAPNLVAGDTNNRADVFRRDRGALIEYCTAKVNSLGCTPQIGGSGTPSASQGSGFLVTAASLINQKFGLLLYSTAGPAATPFQGGTLCLAAPLKRTPGANTGGSPATVSDCSGALAFDFNQRIASGVDPALVAGARVWCQHYARDPGFPPPGNTSLTAGLEFAIEP